MLTHGHDLQSVKEHEGLSLTRYTDTQGHETIGYGTKLPLTAAEMQAIAVDDPRPDVISKFSAELLLDKRYTESYIALIKKFPVVNELNKKREEALTQMCYQLGIGGISTFKRMWLALKSGRFEAASNEILYKDGMTKQSPSKLFTQAQKRCEYYAKVILTGAE